MEKTIVKKYFASLLGSMLLEKEILYFLNLEVYCPLNVSETLGSENQN